MQIDSIDNLKIYNENYDISETEDCYVIYHSYFSEDLKMTMITSIVQLLGCMGNDLQDMPFRINIKKEQLQTNKVVIDKKMNIQCDSTVVYEKYIVDSEYLKWKKINFTLNMILSIILSLLFVLFTYIAITSPVMLIISFSIILFFIILWKKYFDEKKKF